jgi:3-phenylpropionate/cinnamic acid dioxygenase small subunit
VSTSSAIQELPPVAQRDDSVALLRARIDAWLADYVGCLDGRRIERWPEFFEEECFYTIVPMGNDALGLELGLIRCESRAMLKDRA